VLSRSLGPHLPDALLARLMAPDPAARPGEAIVLVTLDPYGRPHPALVSYAELLALDPTRLRLGLHAGTRSSMHLTDSGRATLVFADTELMLYVKADAVPLTPAPGHPRLARFELQVQDVLRDRAEGEEAGSFLTSGITFEWPGGVDAWAPHAARLRAALEP
jgi:hypothetical protein